MKNFVRALRFAWPYRARVAISILAALCAAIFWGLNFTTIYPVLKILGSDQNLQEWVDGTIKKLETEQKEPLQAQVKVLTSKAEEIKKEPASPFRDTRERRLTGELAKAESKLESTLHELHRYHVAKKYLDYYVPSDRFQTLVLIIGLVVAAVAIKGFFEFWQESLVGSVINGALYDVRNLFFRRIIHLDVAQFGDHGTPELMARFTNDMELLGNGLKTLFGRMVAEPLRAVACVVVACWISWQLTLMFLVLVPVGLFILTRVGRLMKRATHKLLERMSSIYKILQETFQGIRVVKAFTREAWERRRFRQATRDYYYKAMWVVNLDALAGPIIEILGVVGVAGALLAGAYLVLNKETHLIGLRMTSQPLEPESLLQLYVLLAAIADPVRKLSSVFTKLQSAGAAADRIFQALDREPRVGLNAEGPRLARHHQDIVFRDVCFSYEPTHPVLTSVHLQVHFGETVALVGKNGCGKSTLVNLLPRFFDPDHGSILIDGVDVRHASLRSLRQQVGLVTQDAILFDDTVYNNIAYGNPRARPEEVEEAARKAYAHDFISKMTHGYQTRVGEAGVKLSGGQKQRLTLARAILRNPSILILDEFTSQSDTESEALIHKALREFVCNRTTFIITHRLNTLEIADRIVVLDQGRITAVGTHQELLQHSSLYQRLHEAHFQRLVA